MAELPTKKQRELLSFIDMFIKGHGYGPSYREVMRALDYKSVSTVATHVNGLIARGWLEKRDNSARSLVVVARPEALGEATTTTVVATQTAEQALRAKIEELRGVDNDANAKAIEVLAEALRILGYESTDTLA